MDSVTDTPALPGMGCPIRKSPDQSLFSGSPKLIAASHVLHRLPTPRHPPIALSCLTISLCNKEFPLAHSPSIHFSKSFGLSRPNFLNLSRAGGGERIRTDDLLRAKQALSHLSYTPEVAVVGLVGIEPTTSRLSGVRSDRN